MKHLGLSADLSKIALFLRLNMTQDEKYEPKINVKVPFTYNQFQTDVYSDTEKDKSVNLLSIPKFTNMECDIYLDKIWLMNGKFYAKWKCRCIHIVEKSFHQTIHKDQNNRISSNLNPYVVTDMIVSKTPDLHVLVWLTLWFSQFGIDFVVHINDPFNDNYLS